MQSLLMIVIGALLVYLAFTDQLESFVSDIRKGKPK
jgi:hypothetical protein